jgi:serine/threonine protein phosphatase PrpC
MGAYLAVPVTAKERFEGQGALTGAAPMNVAYGGAAMQGWRRTMEDAHLAEVGLGMPGAPSGGDAAMFGVFDGHGGAEVALFCQRYMAQELQKLEAFGGDAVEEALVDVFHRMDDMLRDHTFADEIEQLKAREAAEEDEGKADDDGVSPMDALEMIKRVFQLKRFMGENGQPGEGSGEGESGAADEAVAMDDDAAEGSSGQDEPPRAQARPGRAAGAPGTAAGGGVAAGAGSSASEQQPGGSGGPPPWQQQRGGGSGDPAGRLGGDGEAQGEVQRYVEPADARIQAGCTAVVAVIKAGHLYVANAGDSRGVLCRGGAALAMSEDHKPAQETERTRILNAGGGLERRALVAGTRWQLASSLHRTHAARAHRRFVAPAARLPCCLKAASCLRSAACAASTATSTCRAPSVI